MMVAVVVFLSHKSDVEEYKKQKAMHLTCVAKGLQHCPSMPEPGDYGLTEKDVKNDWKEFNKAVKIHKKLFECDA